jgi:drug/metabolite transporter (DMT)-like permease
MSTTIKQSISVVGFLVTLVGAILFSTKAIIVKLAFISTPTTALTLLSLRMLFALPFYLLAVVIVSKRSNNVKLTGKERAIIFVLGILGYYFCIPPLPFL